MFSGAKALSLSSVSIYNRMLGVKQQLYTHSNSGKYEFSVTGRPYLEIDACGKRLGPSLASSPRASEM